ncbi:MAG: type II toxin-antitoxin system antitoxin SocA domain-containing protein [Pseudomonadota bacterium]
MNIGMGYDPRALANALLDIADAERFAMTNLSLNKILYFINSDSIAERGYKLSQLTFEAWQYGPVLPLIYHQFKIHGSNHITSRATKIDSKTGNEVIADYSDIEFETSYIKYRFNEYKIMSPGTLVALSHLPGSPWDLVWNGTAPNVGMKITDDLILGYVKGSKIPGTDSDYVKH